MISPSGHVQHAANQPTGSVLPGASLALRVTAALVGLATAIAAANLSALGFDSEGVARWYLAFCILMFTATVVDPTVGGLSLLSEFFFLFLVAVPANVQISLGQFPWGSDYSENQLVSAFLLLTVSQLALLAGRRLQERRLRRGRSHAPPLDRVLTEGQAKLAVISTVVISALLLLIVGSGPLFSTRTALGEVTYLSSDPTFQLVLIGRSLSLLGLLFAIGLSRRTGSRLHLLLAFIAFSAFHYPPSLSRFELLGSILAVSVCAISLFKVKYKIIFAALSPIFLYWIFPEVKRLGDGQGLDLRAAFSRDVSEYMLRVDFDSYKQVVDSLIVFSRGSDPVSFGSNFFSAILFFVPRGLWGDKAVNSGQLVSESLGYEYTNVANPLPAEAILGFGLAGPVIVFFLFGVIVGLLESSVRRSSGAEGLTVAFFTYALAVGFIVITLRGALNSVAPMFGFALASCVVMYFLASRTEEDTPLEGEG